MGWGGWGGDRLARKREEAAGASVPRTVITVANQSHSSMHAAERGRALQLVREGTRGE